MGESFYEHLGPDGLRELAEEFHVNEDIDFVLGQVNQSDQVLDLACGYGRVTIPIAKAGITIVGIDLDEGLIESARAKAKEERLDVSFDVGNMTSLPYEDGAFTKIFCLWNSFAELIEIVDQEKTLAEIFRALENGGTALLVLPDHHGEDRGVYSFEQNGVELSQYIHDEASLKNLLASSPFTDFKVEIAQMHQKTRLLAWLYK